MKSTEPTPSAKPHRAANQTASNDRDGDSTIPQSSAVSENEFSHADPFSELKQATYQGEKKKEHWMDGMGRLRREIMLEQDFHAKLHEDLLKKIMQHRAVQRGMPVYDTTYNAVRSRKNLFIKTPRPVRSLQYLLPAVESILDFGPLKRRRELEPGDKVAVRPSSLLVLCPTLGHAQGVQDMCTRLIHSYKIGFGVGSLSVPTQKLISVLGGRGFNIIVSTPEFITQWLGLHKAKEALNEALQDVQTLVVDGEASSLRDGEFRELMQGIMDDASLPADTQRIIVSDTFDPERDGSLAKMVLRDDYELHAESRLEEIQAMQIARDNTKKKGKGKWSPKEIRKGEAGLRQSQREVLGCR